MILLRGDAQTAIVSNYKACSRNVSYMQDEIMLWQSTLCNWKSAFLIVVVQLLSGQTRQLEDINVLIFNFPSHRVSFALFPAFKQCISTICMTSHEQA